MAAGSGSIRIAGASTTVAPSSRSRCASALACARARVTAIVRPCSGRDSSQAICSRSAATGPTSVIAGARMPSSAARSATSASVASSVRWPGSVPRSTTATGSSGGAAALDELLRDPRQRAHAHVEDERAREGGERGPVELGLRLGRVLVARDERDAAGDLALGDGDARVGGRGDAGGDARHDLERDARLAQQQRLLAAAAEHERVAALEPHHAAAGARVLEQERVRVLLGDLRPRALLADVDELRVRARVRERLGRDQPVVEDHVGLRDQLDGAHA